MEKNVKVTAGGEKHLVYKNQNGEIMVTHPNQDKGKWDTISLTEKSGSKTIKQGVKDVRDWHKYHPYRKDGVSCKETIKKMFKK